MKKAGQRGPLIIEIIEPGDYMLLQIPPGLHPEQGRVPAEV